MIHTNPEYALLSAANLARMRGKWEEAIDKCAEALRLDPANPNAYSLVGDIYQDQDRKEEAIQWYQMALDIDPGNEADRLKIERLKAPVEIVEKPSTPSFWVRIVLPAGLIVVFVMMSVGFAALMNAQRNNTRSHSVEETAPDGAISAPSHSAINPASGSSLPNPSQEPLEKIETIREYALRASLSRALRNDRELQIFYIQMDPGTADTIVSFFYRPSGDALNTAETLKAAYLVTDAAMRENPSMDACSTRVYITSGDRIAPEVALTTLARRETYVSMESDAIPEALARSFQRLSWNPYLFRAAPIFKPKPSSADSSNAAPKASGENSPS